jgi:hypothetical protein
MSTRAVMDQLNERIENLLHPELRAYGRDDRARLLREARNEPFDSRKRRWRLRGNPTKSLTILVAEAGVEPATYGL